MATKIATPKKETAKVSKKLTENKVQKQAVKKEKSSYSFMLEWHKANKAELFSLSGAIKNVDFTHESGKKLLADAKVSPEQITPAFILKHISDLNGFDSIDGQIFQSVYKNKVKTQVLKVKWSQWNVVQVVRYLAEKNNVAS